MSRETDSSSSGPQRRGGPASAPGTEPYGSAAGAGEAAERSASGADSAAGASAAKGADEPKTETTLTTRIRINIPGSRPIPPVVMRTPVSGNADSGDSGGPDDTAETSAGVPAARREESAVAAAAGAAVGGTAAAAATSGSGAGSARAQGGGDTGGGAERAGETQETSDWFAPRRTPKREEGSSGSGGSGAPGASGDDGRRAATPPAEGGRPYVADPPPESGAQEHPATPPDGVPAIGLSETTGNVPRSAIEELAGLMGSPDRGPSGPTTGPGTGDMPLPPPPPPPSAPPSTGPAAGPPAGLAVPGPAQDAAEPAAGSTLGLGTGSAFSGVTPPVGPGQTAPQPRGPAVGPGAPSVSGAAGVPGAPGAPAGANANDTLIGGIPRLPSAEGGAGYPGAPTVPSSTPEPAAAPEPAPQSGGNRPASKGRSKLVLVGVGLVGVLGIAYGAGLLLDHADIPKGTTVLGVDIGGKEKQAAVDALDSALGDRGTDPLTVVIDGKKTKLKPSVAGLTIDTEATVREVAGRDYNPVSVIGSLIGGSRDEDAVLKVDEEKLEAALSALATDAGGSGSTGAAQDGMVTFEGGKATGVPGKPFKGVDVAKASETIEAAYRDRAATGENTPVTLPVSEQQPTIGKQEIDAAVNGFGKTAMSGWVWLRAGDVEVPFSQATMGKFLTMKPGGGKLQPVIDTEVLAQTYGAAFDNVVIDGGNGTVEMTPQHAAAAMIEALRKKAPAEPEKRVAEVEGASSQ